MATAFDIPDIPDDPRGPGTSDPLGIAPLSLVKRAPPKKDDPLGIYPLRPVKKGAAPLSDLKKEAAQRKPAASSAKKLVLPQGYKLDAPADAEKATLPKRFTETMPSVSDAPASLRREAAAMQPTKDANESLLSKAGDAATSFLHGVGLPTPGEAFEEIREHPLKAAASYIPLTGAPQRIAQIGKGLLDEGQRVRKEEQEAQEALLTPGVSATDRAKAFASHELSALPFVGRLKDVASDAALKAGAEPADITDPKKYLKNLKIIATSPEVLGTTAAAATQAALLGYDALSDAIAHKGSIAHPEIVEPTQRALPGRAEPPTIEGRFEAAPPPGTPGLPAPTEGLAPAEAEAEKTVLDQVSEHPKAAADVQRDLQDIPPEDRQTVLDAINQEGLEAYQRGDKKAAAKAAHHAWILKGIMEAEERAARAARIATPVAEEAPPEPASPAAPVASTDPRLAPAPTPEAAPTTRPVATAEPAPAPEQGTLFGTPEAPAPLATRETPAEEAPQTVGQVAAQIEKTMTRQQILDELGIKKGSGDSRLRAQTKRLALQLAISRAGAGSVTPAAAPVAAAEAVQAAPVGAPEAAPPAAATPAPEVETAAAKKPAGRQATVKGERERILADHFAPGNVIYSGYWNDYDKVLDFKPPDENGQWQVQVVRSDKDGNPVPGERPRWHATFPDMKKDKVVVRAPVPPPLSPATPAPEEAAPAQQPEPGLVGKVAKKIGKGKRPVAAEPTAATPADDWEALPTVETELADARAMAAARAKPKAEVEHNKEDKAFEATAPDGHVDAKGEGAMIAEYGKGKEFKTQAQARKAITQWEAGLMPVEQFRAQAPAAPPAAPVAAPEAPEAQPPAAAPEAPAAATVPTGPVTVKRVAGATHPTWQVPGTDYTVHLSPDGYIIHKGDEHIGKASDLDDAKTQIQAHMPAQPEAAAPAAAPAPATPAAAAHAGSDEMNKAFAEARARSRKENARLATAEKSMRHNAPVIAVNDDAMVMIERFAGLDPRSNGLIIKGDKANKIIADMRQFAAFDPEHRQSVVNLADLMEAHRTPHGNVIFHRSILPDEKINQIALEELFHDWQHRYLIPAKQLTTMHGAMLLGPSSNAWRTIIGNLVKFYRYTHTVATLEAPAWVASGDYAHLGVTPDEAVKLLGDYFEAAHRILGSEAVENLPPINKLLEGKVHDEIGRRGFGKPAKDVSGRDRGRVDPLQSAPGKLPEKLPRGAAGAKGRKRAASETELDAAQSQQPIGPAPLETVQAEAEEHKPENWIRRGAQEFTEERGGQFVTPPKVEADSRAMEIADAYEEMKHEPDNPAVKASYNALKADIDKQWDFATKKLGVTFEPWDDPKSQPYKNSAEMTADVVNNKHLYFFRGVDMSADHPMAEVDPATGLTYNEKMRAVHDFFGHAVDGHQFGPNGEEMAWLEHSQAFRPEAIPALTTETKGQNSWVNSGPQMRGPDGNLLKKGDPGWKPASEREYAKNKAGLLPRRFYYRQDAPAVFVSPNVFNLPGVPEAQAQLTSRIHKQFAEQAHQLAADMGLNVTVEHSLGSWEGGAENSIAIHLPIGTDPEQVRFYEASLGRLGYQFATGSFIPNPEGKDFINTFWVDGKNVSTGKVAKVLLDNGIENSTITPADGRAKHGYAVTVIDTGNALRDNLRKVKTELGVQSIDNYRGSAEFPGRSESRELAESEFSRILDGLEHQRPSFRGLRRRFESRPDYILLYDTIRQAQEPRFVGVEHGSRTPELVQIDPAYHGKGPQGGGESKRKTAYPEYWVDRSYFQIKGTRGERPYITLPHQYDAIFNHENLYDFNSDPDGLLAQVPDDLRGTPGFQTYYEKLIKDNGYDGYFDSERGQVAAFHKTPVEQKLKAGEIKLPEAGEGGLGTLQSQQRVKTDIDRRPNGFDVKAFDPASKSPVGRLQIDYSSSPGTAIVKAVDVDEGYQRRGIARRLYEEAKTELQQRGIKVLKGSLEGSGPLQIREQVFGPGNTTFFHGSESIPSEKAQKLMDVDYRYVRAETRIESPEDEGDTGILQSRQRKTGPGTIEEVRDEAKRLPGIGDYMPDTTVELGADPDEEQKNNLTWDDVKDVLIPEERVRYEHAPEERRKYLAMVNMMPNRAEWDAAAKVGRVGALWYERSSRAFDALIASSPEYFKRGDKEKFLNFVSALSPVQTVRLNLGMAINLWAKWHKAGRPMDVQWQKPKTFEKVANEDARLYRIMAGLDEEEAPKGALWQEQPAKPGAEKKKKKGGVVLKSRLFNAIRALQGQPLSGPKVGAFAPNLGENVDKSTNDTWMAIFSGVDPNVINQQHIYDAVTTHVRLAARENDLNTRQSQAAIWSFIKTLAEASGWGPGRWIPPQQVIDENLLSPELIALRSQDFADLLRDDYTIRALLSRIGVDLNALDRNLKRKVPARPTVGQGAAKELAGQLSGAAGRLTAARADPRIEERLAQKLDTKQRRFQAPDESVDNPSPLRKKIALAQAQREAAKLKENLDILQSRVNSMLSRAAPE
jgi:GNAT superfamily N-acetyltransferase